MPVRSLGNVTIVEADAFATGIAFGPSTWASCADACAEPGRLCRRDVDAKSRWIVSIRLNRKHRTNVDQQWHVA